MEKDKTSGNAGGLSKLKVYETANINLLFNKLVKTMDDFF